MKLTQQLTKTLTRIGLAAVLLPTLNLQLFTAHAQGTAFTYQGVLNDGGTPATGLYDLEFRAFDAVSGGAQQGGLVTASDVPVTHGLFTTTLDFGAAVFTGPARWLNIAVRPGASAGAYADLLPRQPILASPYAVFAGGSAAAGVTGTLPDARLSANVALRSGGNFFTDSQTIYSGNLSVLSENVGFAIDDGGNGPRLGFIKKFGYGPMIAASADAAVVFGHSDQFSVLADIGSATLTEQMRINPNGNVGIGTNDPTSKLEVRGTVKATAFVGDGSGLTALNASQVTSGTLNAAQILTLDAATKLTGTLPDARLSANVALRAGGNALTGNQTVMSGNAGIGTTTPVSTLDVYGSGSTGGFASPARALKVRSTASFGAALGVDASTVAGGKEWDFFSTGGNAAEGQGKLILRNDTDAVNAMTITTNGNVGIGTTSPSVPLSLGTSVPGDALKLALYDVPGDTYGLGIVGGAMTFHIAGSERMRITSSSGIVARNAATGNQTALFQLQNDVGPNGVIFKNSSTRSADGGAHTMTVRNDAGDLRLQSSAVATGGIMVKATTGNVGIGTATPNVGFPLSIKAAGVALQSWLRSDNTPKWNVNMDSFGGAPGLYFSEHGINPANLVLREGGNVGIGTLDPQARLHVVGSGPAFGAETFAYFDPNFNNLPIQSCPSCPGWTYSILADGRIAAAGFHARSDGRIKQIIGTSDGAKDLGTLLGIQVTDYTHKDFVANGGAAVKKVIAQQIENVFPQAVSKSTDVVPDIYRQAMIQDGWVQLATDLKVGERVKLMGEKEAGVHEVLEVKAGAFRTAFKPATDKVFVIGREVKDFRSVDYDALAMLNVSATQELARKLDAQESELSDLRAELSKLRSERTSLAQMASDMEARFVRLEQAMNNATLPAVKDVSASADVK